VSTTDTTADKITIDPGAKTIAFDVLFLGRSA